MHHHFQECDGGDSHTLEVIGVLFPGFRFVEGFLLGGGIVVQGIAGGVEEFDRVGELCGGILIINLE